MANSTHLSEQFEPIFHGTTHPFQPGDRVLPHSMTGNSPFAAFLKPGDHEGQVVSGSTDENDAHMWGQQGSVHRQNPDRLPDEVDTTPRSRVFAVQPEGPVSHPDGGEEGDREMASARVLHEVDIPGDLPRPVQGKLPIDKDWDNWRSLGRHKGDPSMRSDMAAGADRTTALHAALSRSRAWREGFHSSSVMDTPPAHLEGTGALNRQGHPKFPGM